MQITPALRVFYIWYASLMKEAATEYADIVFQKLYDYEYNEQMIKLHFIGGGTRII